MQRVTEKQLESVVHRINIITNSPQTTYTRSITGNYKANIGNYHLDHAYGGVALHRMHSDGGGVEDIFGGHYSKRELLNRMFAFIKGIEVQL